MPTLLTMAGLDHTTADIAVRGAFSPDAAKRREMLRAILADTRADVSGCALIATCNRTELYVSHSGDGAENSPDCVRLLCESLGLDAAAHRAHFIVRRERAAAEHLMRVASGLESSVPGDDQIITQVRTAVEAARDADTADPLVEALFRAAVAAGKKVKTLAAPARDSRDRTSVASRAVEEIARRLAPPAGKLTGKKALVVGNGTIGILAASALLEHGCGVTMTLRDPRRKIDLPSGCRIVDYAERHAALAGCDVAVSATSSPNFTLTAAELRDTGADATPKLFVDLAVPRDIDPAIAERKDTTVLNVDDLRGGGDGENTAADASARERRARADEIIHEEADRFDLWRRNRRRYTEHFAGAPDFPIFINLHRAPVLVAGGGKVAARRAEKLLAAGALVRVVAPEVGAEMEKLLDKHPSRQNLQWTRGEYAPEHMDGVTLVLAATDRREVNAEVGRDAKKRGILVSVADDSRECTFYFPAIIKSDFLTAGLVSNNGDHAMVKRAARRISEEMESIDADCKSGEPRE